MKRKEFVQLVTTVSSLWQAGQVVGQNHSDAEFAKWLNACSQRATDVLGQIRTLPSSQLAGVAQQFLNWVHQLLSTPGIQERFTKHQQAQYFDSIRQQYVAAVS